MSGTSNPKGGNVLDNVSKMFNNPQYSDVTIKVYELEIPAHQFVICMQSEYFKKAFHKPEPPQGDKTESQGFAEAESMTIEFKEGSGPAYWRVLEYLYTGDYSNLLSTGVFHDDPDLLKHVRVYSLADMFLIKKLKTLVEEKLEVALKSFQMSRLFSDCVRDVYSVTGEGNKMRRIMVNAGVAKLVELGKKQYGGSHPYIVPALLEQDYMQDLIHDCGDFAFDFMIAIYRVYAK